MAMQNDYFLVQGSKDDIATKVAEQLQNDAALVGGLCVTYNPECGYKDKMVYTQAMLGNPQGLSPMERGLI